MALGGAISGGEPSGGPLEMIALPPVSTVGSVPIEEVLARRRSVRRFAPEPVSREALAQLLWAAQGVSGEDKHGSMRTAPSAGRAFPLEVFVATVDGLMRYRPPEHALEVVDRTDLRAPLAATTGIPEKIGTAPVLISIAGVPARTAATYGERAERYVLLEAGHATQNVLLQATALGLASVPVGAFDDDELSRVLRLPPGWVPLYLVPVGHPATKAGSAGSGGGQAA